MSPEMRAMLGRREDDDDGFTYVAGKFKAGRVKRSRNRNSADQAERHDKRAVKSRENRRIKREWSDD